MAASWLPVDDPHFALDPSGEWYDEAVEGDVIQDHISVDAPTTQPKKRVQSKVSVSLDFFTVILHLTHC